VVALTDAKGVGQAQGRSLQGWARPRHRDVRTLGLDRQGFYFDQSDRFPHVEAEGSRAVVGQVKGVVARLPVRAHACDKRGGLRVLSLHWSKQSEVCTWRGENQRWPLQGAQGCPLAQEGAVGGKRKLGGLGNRRPGGKPVRRLVESMKEFNLARQNCLCKGSPVGQAAEDPA
jgi:hypothetical protein